MIVRHAVFELDYEVTQGAWPVGDGYDAFAQAKDAQAYLRDPARSDKPFVMLLSDGPPHFLHHSAPAC